MRGAAEPPAKGGGKMEASVHKMDFGKTAEGTPVDLYVLTNAKGTVAKVMTYGAILTELDVADRNGKLDDVVLGFDNLKDPRHHSHFDFWRGYGKSIVACAFRLRQSE